MLMALEKKEEKMWCVLFSTEGYSIHLDIGLDPTGNKPDTVLQQMAVGATAR